MTSPMPDNFPQLQRLQADLQDNDSLVKLRKILQWHLSPGDKWIERCLQLTNDIDIGRHNLMIGNSTKLREMVDRAVKADAEALRESLLNTAASLAAAISLLERGSKKAAPSDKMFDMMLSDYRKTLASARTTLNRK